MKSQIATSNEGMKCRMHVLFVFRKNGAIMVERFFTKVSGEAVGLFSGIGERDAENHFFMWKRGASGPGRRGEG